MKNCVYFAEKPSFPKEFPALPPELSPEPLRLVSGCGFTPAGLWRAPPLPSETVGLVVDDLFPPGPQGLAAARRFLSAWEGTVIFDLERPRQPELETLIRALAGERLVLPPAYGDLPHGAILTEPWPGGCDFSRWLAAWQSRYGPVLLDAAPLRRRVRPGGPWEPWEGPLPPEGFPCPGLGCLHRRRADGTILFWDTRRTLAVRLKAAKVPAILFPADWTRLPAR